MPKQTASASSQGRLSVTRLVGTAASLVAVIGFLYGAIQLVDNRIRRAVHDDAFIREVASQVRPFIIFDAGGTIHVDSGGMRYLESVEVDSVGVANAMRTFRIVVTPKEHLSYEPLLEPLTVELLLVRCDRGRGHEFIYRATEIMRLDAAENPARFRLEIFR